jgi:AbrB family looped-hinge helix DNA binding protein
MSKSKFWGSATVGTKGQIVIPSEAREAFGIKEGDKMLIVSPDNHQTLIIIKPEVLEEYMEKMQTGIQTILNSNKDSESDQ